MAGNQDLTERVPRSTANFLPTYLRTQVEVGRSSAFFVCVTFSSSFDCDIFDCERAAKDGDDLPKGDAIKPA